MTAAVAVTTDLPARLGATLAEAPTGIAWIYDTLSVLARDFALEDAALVLDDEALRRQVFRLGGQRLGDSWIEGVIFRAEQGLHSRGEVPREIEQVVVDLARVALRLDRYRHEASHDLLTGTLNRRAFDEVLGAACAQSSRYGWPFALVVIDLDDFKAVNDRFGHSVGDDCLRAVGSELRRGLRAGDIAARIGGDEFALVLPGADRKAVEGLADRLRGAIAAALPDVVVGLSTGVAVSPDDGDEPDALFKLADEQLYEEKGR